MRVKDIACADIITIKMAKLRSRSSKSCRHIETLYKASYHITDNQKGACNENRGNWDRLCRAGIRCCFSEFGFDVTCVDNDPNKIARITAGDMPIYEPGLADLVSRNAAGGRLHFTIDLKTAVAAADAVFIAVGTPTRRGDGHADLSFVYAVAREVAPCLNGYTVVITKSTVPVGTGREVAKIIASTNPDAAFDVASNPEFLREGAAIADFMRPDRVVVGAETEAARDVLRALYRPSI